MAEKYITFRECEDAIKEVKSLRELFEIWKSAQETEIDEIEEKIREIQERNKERSEGDIFEHDLYKVRGEKNKNTISSHFVQFFYKEGCGKCIKGKNNIPEGEKPWKFVLKNAFNMDGHMTEEDFNENRSGYKYICLLKEANDSSKVCVENYKSLSCEGKNVNVWIQRWLKGKTAPMLKKLGSAFKEIGCDFKEEVAYMNVNKRGGTVQTAGMDETAVINYAKQYWEFILKEISVLAGENEEVTVFVCGKSKEYWKGLMNALTGEKLEEGEDKLVYKYPQGEIGKKIVFINITHPSGRVGAEELAKQMQICKG